jgi:hypothetical protein
MLSALMIAYLGGFLAQQPKPLVTQTELPPPATATPEQPVRPPAVPSVQSPKTQAQTQVSPQGKDATGAKQETSESKADTAPPAEAAKPVRGTRVAAFWIILPGK